MKKLIEGNKRRDRRRKSIRAKISGTSERPRLSVFKSNCHIYIQAIDDIAGKTLVAVSNLEKDLRDVKSTVEGAEKLGQIAGERLKAINIEAVVFDRGGYIYHGKVKAIADGARKAGIKF
ncbi:MAG: 50S ribosomal protein L18 [Spirochaetia bacterium]|nr:50S ribosomal protein L18 [Spirochaetia bacterium]